MFFGGKSTGCHESVPDGSCQTGTDPEQKHFSQKENLSQEIDIAVRLSWNNKHTLRLLLIAIKLKKAKLRLGQTYFIRVSQTKCQSISRLWEWCSLIQLIWKIRLCSASRCDAWNSAKDPPKSDGLTLLPASAAENYLSKWGAVASHCSPTVWTRAKRFAGRRKPALHQGPRVTLCLLCASR